MQPNQTHTLWDSSVMKMQTNMLVEVGLDATPRFDKKANLSDAEVIYRAIAVKRDELLKQVEEGIQQSVEGEREEVGRMEYLAQLLIEIRILTGFLQSLYLGLTAALTNELKAVHYGQPKPPE